MSEPPEIDLSDFHEKFTEQAAEFLEDAVEVVASYTRFEERIPTKAVLFELDSITPSNPDDLGTEQFYAELRFVAYVFVSFTDDSPELAVRLLATKLMTWIYGNRFGCPVMPAKIIEARPDAAQLPGRTGREGEAEDYKCWRVEWSHEALFGESAWDNEGVQPTEVWTTGPDGATEQIA